MTRARSGGRRNRHSPEGASATAALERRQQPGQGQGAVGDGVALVLVLLRERLDEEPRREALEKRAARRRDVFAQGYDMRGVSRQAPELHPTCGIPEEEARLPGPSLLMENGS